MVNVQRQGNTITITGHSTIAPLGSNIVCAAISSIIGTTVSAIQKIYSSNMRYTDDGTTITIEILEDNLLIKLLLENMYDKLGDIREEYPTEIGGNVWKDLL